VCITISPSDSTFPVEDLLSFERFKSETRERERKNGRRRKRKTREGVRERDREGGKDGREDTEVQRKR
jgi:hypothetical protein